MSSYPGRKNPGLLSQLYHSIQMFQWQQLLLIMIQCKIYNFLLSSTTPQQPRKEGRARQTPVVTTNEEPKLTLSFKIVISSNLSVTFIKRYEPEAIIMQPRPNMTIYGTITNNFKTLTPNPKIKLR